MGKCFDYIIDFVYIYRKMGEINSAEKNYILKEDAKEE